MKSNRNASSSVVDARDKAPVLQNSKASSAMAAQAKHHTVLVFITVDTEPWPSCALSDKAGFREEYDRDVFGVTPLGEFGIRHMMDVMDAYGCRGVFLLEALHACGAGTDLLTETVATIQGRGHEVQLHLHPEWLRRLPLLPVNRGIWMRSYTEEEQFVLIEHGLRNLRAAGARKICAFRAGGFGANFDTLKALARHGLLYDTSLNRCFWESTCGLRTDRELLQPKNIEGVYEFPIAFFADWPGHFRPVQIGACSVGEIVSTLLHAWADGWYAFVILLHSFEFLHRARGRGIQRSASRLVARRFEQVCRFLAAHRDKFRTTTFSEIDPDAIPQFRVTQVPRSNVLRTAYRYAEQLVGRWY